MAETLVRRGIRKGHTVVGTDYASLLDPIGTTPDDLIFQRAPAKDLGTQENPRQSLIDCTQPVQGKVLSSDGYDA